MRNDKERQWCWTEYCMSRRDNRLKYLTTFFFHIQDKSKNKPFVLMHQREYICYHICWRPWAAVHTSWLVVGKSARGRVGRTCPLWHPEVRNEVLMTTVLLGKLLPIEKRFLGAWRVDRVQLASLGQLVIRDLEGREKLTEWDLSLHQHHRDKVWSWCVICFLKIIGISNDWVTGPRSKGSLVKEQEKGMITNTLNSGSNATSLGCYLTHLLPYVYIFLHIQMSQFCTLHICTY